MKALKKIAIRLIIIEVIASLSVLVVTPFLFGSIKPYNPKIKTSNNIEIAKVETKANLATKKAEPKKEVMKVAVRVDEPVEVKAETKPTVKASGVEEAEMIEPAPEPKPKKGQITIQPVGEPKLIEEPGTEVPIEEPQLIK